MRSQAKVAFAVVAILSTTSSALRATESAPVVVTVTGKRTLRVQVAEGRTLPCDSHDNQAVFNRRIAPGETVHASITGDCICMRHTTGSFGDAEWTPSGLVCRPRICRGRICRPAPDPTIRLALP
jgi:hypothetical protein